MGRDHDALLGLQRVYNRPALGGDNEGGTIGWLRV